MLKSYIFIFMLFAHCIGDYILQKDFISKAKRKSFWLNIKDEKVDTFAYLSILCVHAFIWSFCIHLPLILFLPQSNIIVVSIFINFLIHGIIDDLKANRNKISMTIDQLIHVLQIVITYILFIVL